MRNIYILLIFTLFFSACAIKKNQKISNQQVLYSEKKQATQEDFEDEFEDEFEENANDVNDPFEPYNRIMTSFNDKVFVYFFNPISKVYATVLPRVVRKGISNIFKNLLYPARLTNNILQGKVKNSFEETQRFIINSTIGIFGIFDIAKEHFDINAHNEDFGQTLGYWGIASGPHIVLPFFGPSNLRDIFQLPVDNYIDPTNSVGSLPYKIPNNFVQGSVIFTLNYVNKNSLNLGLYDTLKKDSLDFYTFTRNFYEEKRKNDIKE